jgi:hypothetical protein
MIGSFSRIACIYLGCSTATREAKKAEKTCSLLSMQETWGFILSPEQVGSLNEDFSSILGDQGPEPAIAPLPRQAVATPEPSELWLLGSGLAAFIAMKITINWRATPARD